MGEKTDFGVEIARIERNAENIQSKEGEQKYEEENNKPVNMKDLI